VSDTADKSNGMTEGNHCKANYIYNGGERDTQVSNGCINLPCICLHFEQEKLLEYYKVPKKRWAKEMEENHTAGSLTRCLHGAEKQDPR